MKNLGLPDNMCGADIRVQQQHGLNLMSNISVRPIVLQNSELRTQNSEFYLTTLRTHRRGHRFINASRFSNGWYWNKASEYSLTKLTKTYNLQRLNKEMMPYLVGVMLSGVPLRQIAAILEPLRTPYCNSVGAFEIPITKTYDVAYGGGTGWLYSPNQPCLSFWCRKPITPE